MIWHWGERISLISRRFAKNRSFLYEKYQISRDRFHSNFVYQLIIMQTASIPKINKIVATILDIWPKIGSQRLGVYEASGLSHILDF